MTDVTDTNPTPETKPEPLSPSRIWLYLGAMLTENKAGRMAASFTRVLGVLTYVLWVVLTVLASLELVVMVDAVTYVLMALVLGKSLKDLGKGISGHSAYSNPPSGDE